MNRVSFSRITAAGTEVRIARSDSMGLQGTYENVDHHAAACKPLIDILVAGVEHIPFKRWVQGHNVHSLTTTDGRQYRFRPLNVGKGENLDGRYIGLEMFEVLDGGRKNSAFQITSNEEAFVALQVLAVYARPLYKQYHCVEVGERWANGVVA